MNRRYCQYDLRAFHGDGSVSYGPDDRDFPDPPEPQPEEPVRMPVCRECGRLGDHHVGCPNADEDEPLDEGDEDRCSDPDGHEWAYTGTAYGGDDERYHGEGRCYCVHCGADGDA